MNLLKVVHAEYVADYVLRLTFSDGAVKTFDFWPLAQEGVCVKLQDLNYFRAFTTLGLWIGIMKSVLLRSICMSMPLLK